MCTWRALALCALSSPSPSAWPTSLSPAPLTGDRQQARPAPALATAPSPSTPGSSVRGLKESVFTIGSDRARPLSGGFVNNAHAHRGAQAPAHPGHRRACLCEYAHLQGLIISTLHFL
eukprot:6189272-Pleurochrysis_carterae.AAC.1